LLPRLTSQGASDTVVHFSDDKGQKPARAEVEDVLLVK